MNKSYSIREAKPENAGRNLKLVKEFADYEKLPDSVKIGEKGKQKSQMICLHGTTVYYYNTNQSMVTKLKLLDIPFGITVSPGMGERHILKIFYVSPEHRGVGLGRSLIQCVAKLCHEKGCSRLRLSVRSWNQLAKRFYKKIKAVNLTETEERELMQIDGEDFSQLAMQAPDVTLSE